MDDVIIYQNKKTSDYAKDVMRCFLALRKSLKIKQYIELENNIDKLISHVLPKKTKVFSTQFYKDISAVSDDRLLILIVHLYLDNFIIEICKHNFKDYYALEKSRIADTFYKRVKLLETQKILDKHIVKDLLFINRIRNNFVHELNYDIGNINLRELFYVNQFTTKDDVLRVKNRRANKALSRLLIKFEVLIISSELHELFPFLYLLDKKHNSS